MKIRKIFFLIALLGVIGLCGCNNSDNETEALKKQMEELQKQNEELSNRLDATVTLTPMNIPVPINTPIPEPQNNATFMPTINGYDKVLNRYKDKIVVEYDKSVNRYYISADGQQTQDCLSAMILINDAGQRSFLITFRSILEDWIYMDEIIVICEDASYNVDAFSLNRGSLSSGEKSEWINFTHDTQIINDFESFVHSIQNSQDILVRFSGDIYVDVMLPEKEKTHFLMMWDIYCTLEEYSASTASPKPTVTLKPTSTPVPTEEPIDFDELFNAQVAFEQEGQTFAEYDRNGNIIGEARIDNISYSFNMYWDLNIYFEGQVTQYKKDFELSYKLLDEEDYVINTGSIHIYNLSEGDKFKTVFTQIMGVMPIDANYKLVLTDKVN